MSDRPLTAKETAYTNARIAGMGPSDAFRVAYNASRLTPARVAIAAAKVERRDSIRVVIDAANAKALQAAEVTAEDLTRELAYIAFGNLADVAPWDATGPHLIPSDQLAPHQQRLVSSIKVKRERQLRGSFEEPEMWEVEYMEIKREDRLSAIDKLLRVHGSYAPEKVDARHLVAGRVRVEVVYVDGDAGR